MIPYQVLTLMIITMY